MLHRCAKLWCLLTVLLLIRCAAVCSAHGYVAPRAFVSTQDNSVSERWFASTLSSGVLPFSFDYDGKPSSGFLATWTQQHSIKKLDAQRTQDEYVYTDPETGLAVRWVVVRYSDSPAIEWTVHFQNNGPSDTPIISNIQALDLRVRPTNPGDFTLHYSLGSHAGPDDYQPEKAALTPGADVPLGGASGWSTTEVLSYFNLLGPDGNLLIGIGWPGNWKARFTRDPDLSLHAVAGQGLTHFLLHPGEEARSPLIALAFYQGPWVQGQNVWRRWMMAHNLPRVNGQLPPPILASAAPEIATLHYDEAAEIKAMDLRAQQKLPVDYWWIDAGWYPCNGAWDRVGTWREDRTQFPDGLRSVTDHARSLGIKQILWFEPERVWTGSDLDVQHPEWLIKLPGNDSRLFNLGIPAARAYLTDLISQCITDYGVDLFRSDFNADPLPYWRAQDAPDRQGMTEIKYIEGFLSFWDDLRARHPGMLIDTCASGGRRNDLEVLRRAVPLLQSDYHGDLNGTQMNTYGMALWIPYHGAGGASSSPDSPVYLFRTHMGTSHSYAPYSNTDFALVNRLATQEKQIQPYYFGDFYPLTAWSLDNSVWIVWQYDRPDLSSGIVQAFRRPDNAQPSQTYHLDGLDPKAIYQVHDFDSGQDATQSGAALMEQGLTITLSDKPGAALLLYRRLDDKGKPMGPTPAP